MKRKNLVLNENLLQEATRVLGVKTYSAAINTALAEVLRFRRILNLPSAFDQGLWRGDLSQMREDQIPTRIRTKKKVRSRKH
jgi:Arc/MetJ family transcription regulator